MLKAGVARFPLPPAGRIPNFVGAEAAARRLRETQVWRRARVVKINPDSPQLPVRLAALEDGKLLYMPSPRLRHGLFVLDPKRIRDPRRAVSIGGMEKFGRRAELREIRRVDLVVAGSVAVNRQGARVGKGGGYSDREYAILRELGLPDAPVATTVHPLQIVDSEIPMREHDLPVDFILTPEESIETRTRHPKPRGILWDRVSAVDLKEMPLLAELKPGS